MFLYIFAEWICIYVTSLLTNQNLFRDSWSYWEHQMHQPECLPTTLFMLLVLCPLFCRYVYRFKIYCIFVGTMQQCWHCHLLTDNENTACIIFFFSFPLDVQTSTSLTISFSLLLHYIIKISQSVLIVEAIQWISFGAHLTFTLWHMLDLFIIYLCCSRFSWVFNFLHCFCILCHFS